MLKDEFIYEECFEQDDIKTKTFYFTGPKDMLKKLLNKNFPEACASTISIEVPMLFEEAKYAGVSISPTAENEDGYYDYEWHDLNLSYDEIEGLLSLTGDLIPA